MVGDPWTYPVAFVAALIIATVTSPAGVSGAVLLLPFQVSVLGTPSPAVTPTNLLYNVVATPGALYRYWRQGQTGGVLTRQLLLGTLPGVIAGSVIRVELLPGPQAADAIIAVVLIPLGTYLVVRKTATNPSGVAALAAARAYRRHRRLRWRHLRHRRRVDPRPDPHRSGPLTDRRRPCDSRLHARHLNRRRRHLPRVGGITRRVESPPTGGSAWLSVAVVSSAGTAEHASSPDYQRTRSDGYSGPSSRPSAYGTPTSPSGADNQRLSHRAHANWSQPAWRPPPIRSGSGEEHVLPPPLRTGIYHPPAMAPTMKNGSVPPATASGSGWSGDSCDRSFSQAKKRTNGRRLRVAGSRMVP